MLSKAVLIVLLGVLLVMSSLPAPAQDVRPVIIDTDMAFDDAMAILSILNNPAFSVQAITVTGTGIDEENTTAEWNIYGDPHSARLVVESGAPVTLVPLDATNEAPVTPEFLNVLSEQKASPEAEFIYEGLLASTESIENGRYFFWDLLAAAVLTNPELVTLEIREITVIDTPGPEDGRTKPVGNGSEVLVATAPDSATFERHFINVINY
jgi:inosine-uridine nucleoside N-ribohydrolase